MAEPLLPQDFREFLRLLNAKGVEYLLVGGHAVGYHGYPRATADMDIWISATPESASKLAGAFREFGMDDPKLNPDLFRKPDGALMLETGYAQGPAVKEMLEQAGVFGQISIEKDVHNNDRIVIATKDTPLTPPETQPKKT